MSVQPDRSPFARPGAFHRPDDRGMGTEREVSALLAAHARWLKPRVVVETGTFHADTAAMILDALGANAAEGFPGELFTFEVDPEAHAHAARRLTGRTVNAHRCTLQEFLTAAAFPRPVDLAFVDSAYSARAADVETLEPLMAPRGLLFVHDADMPPMRDQVTAWASEFHVVRYPTPRGLALLQRRP